MRVDDLFVGGSWVPSTGTERIEVVDPATEEVWGSVPDCTAEDVDAAMRAADEAFRTGPWPRMSPTERGEVLLRVADEIELVSRTARGTGEPAVRWLGRADGSY